MKKHDKYLKTKINSLTILSIDDHNPYITDCVCDCGQSAKVRLHNILNNNTKSCGCLHKKLLIGQKYSSKYVYNESLFKTLTPTSEYILGLLYSDGNISKKENKGSINLQEGDRDILEKISILFKNNNKLTKIPGKVDIKTGNLHKTQYKFYFCNKIIYEDLKNFGLTPNKSKNLIVNNLLKNSKDFWRGMLDGDGSIFISKNKKLFKLSLCGASYDVLKNFREFCMKHVDTKANIHKCKDREFWQFAITGDYAKKIHHILYNESELFLNRKKFIDYGN